MKRRAARVRVVFVLPLLIMAAFGAVLLLSASDGTAGPQKASAAAAGRAVGLTPGRAPTASEEGQPFAGVAAVGALFTLRAGKLGKHFCTASVVHSARGDLAVTAAHCMTGQQGPVVFVPGYASGTEPYGIWPVTAVYTDQAWQSSQNPDDDVAFLRLSGTGAASVEAVTGAEQVAASAGPPALVQVVGYPDDADRPILCVSWAQTFSATQLEFDCGGYSDGTSGGPFLAGISAASGDGTIIGVIGGYKLGGDSPVVSYASAFGPAVTALYRSAQAAA